MEQYSCPPGCGGLLHPGAWHTAGGLLAAGGGILEGAGGVPMVGAPLDVILRWGPVALRAQALLQ